MADDRKSEADEIGELLANDPRAHVVPAQQQAWLLSGKALNAARAALGRNGEPGEKPEHSDDPDPSFASPKRPTLSAKVEHVGDENDTQKVLAEVAAEAGGELIVERPRRTVAPMPTRMPDGSFVNRRCPHCGGDQFAHSYGDELCRCAGCGAQLDVDELIV